MDTGKYLTGACPIGRGVALVGDAWSMLILRDAGSGRTRFDQFRKNLGVAPNILAGRLKALTEAGLLEKRSYCERPPRDEYLITEAGRDFLPVLHALGAWASRHHGSGALSYAVDRETGAVVEPVVIDRATGRAIGSLALRIVTPGGA